VKAGRELDALVAEKVMGLQPLRREVPPDPGAFLDLPHYSTDIAAAWEVVEKLTGRRDKDIGFALTVNPGTIGTSFSALDGTEHWHVNASTAPLAICLAALKVVGVDIEERRRR
jgi:hypothetical protein